jgi:1,2-dihydroxy-3-keto-5-methylthiopentene dioxygenase
VESSALQRQEKIPAMATLKMADGQIYRQADDIQKELAPLQIQLRHWPLGTDPEMHRLLAQDQLSDGEKETVLTALDHYFQELQSIAGYQARDLIAIHPAIPGLDEMLAKFDRCHTHADDEVRYIVAGSGIFGFVRPDRSQVELTIEAGEYINVPAGTEHWFYLTENQRVKAVRYFVDSSGWTPLYTDTPIVFRLAATS